MSPRVVIVGDGAVGLSFAHCIHRICDVDILSRRRRGIKRISLTCGDKSGYEFFRFKSRWAASLSDYDVAIFCLKHSQIKSVKIRYVFRRDCRVLNVCNVPTSKREIRRLVKVGIPLNALLTSQVNVVAGALQIYSFPLTLELDRQLPSINKRIACVLGRLKVNTLDARTFHIQRVVKLLTTFFAHLRHMQSLAGIPSVIEENCIYPLLGRFSLIQDERSTVVREVKKNILSLKSDFIPSGINDILKKNSDCEFKYITDYLGFSCPSNPSIMNALQLLGTNTRVSCPRT